MKISVFYKISLSGNRRAKENVQILYQNWEPNCIENGKYRSDATFVRYFEW